MITSTRPLLAIMPEASQEVRLTISDPPNAVQKLLMLNPLSSAATRPSMPALMTSRNRPSDSKRQRAGSGSRRSAARWR